MILRPSDTLPVDAPDAAHVQHYAYIIERDPRWLHGLKRPDGSLYRPRSNRASRAGRKRARSAA